jgi:hypothetical protein
MKFISIQSNHIYLYVALVFLFVSESIQKFKHHEVESVTYTTFVL